MRLQSGARRVVLRGPNQICELCIYYKHYIIIWAVRHATYYYFFHVRPAN